MSVVFRHSYGRNTASVRLPLLCMCRPWVLSCIDLSEASNSSQHNSFHDQWKLGNIYASQFIRPKLFDYCWMSICKFRNKDGKEKAWQAAYLNSIVFRMCHHIYQNQSRLTTMQSDYEWPPISPHLTIRNACCFSSMSLAQWWHCTALETEWWYLESIIIKLLPKLLLQGIISLATGQKEANYHCIVPCIFWDSFLLPACSTLTTIADCNLATDAIT